MHRPLLSAAAVVATAAAVGSVAATQPQSVASTPVELAALVVVGSSTNPTGDGIREFYGGKFEPEDGQVTTVNFWTGPPGIYQGIAQNIADDDTVVLSSGWGAANVSLLLTYLKATGSNDPVLTNRMYVVQQRGGPERWLRDEASGVRAPRGQPHTHADRARVSPW